MAEVRTRKHDASVSDFIGAVSNDTRRADALLPKLGKYKRGKGCLYINKLADVDMTVLERLVRAAYAWQLAQQH